MEDNNLKSLKKYPYSERQLVFVTNDRVASISTVALSKEKPLEWIKSWVKDHPILAANIAVGGLIMLPNVMLLGAGVGLAGVNFIKFLLNFKKETGLNIRPISKSQAKELKFPPGHYRKKVIYVGHPLEWDKYYPMSDFHKFVFEHKFTEVINLLMSLGAIEISVEREQGYSSEISADLGVDFFKNMGGGINFDKSRTRKAMYKASFNSRNKKTIPSDLVWFPNEPSWQQIANGRMNYELNDFSLKLEYTDNFGIDTELNGKIKDSGFNIGGNFTSHKKTIWNISGKFS